MVFANQPYAADRHFASIAYFRSLDPASLMSLRRIIRPIDANDRQATRNLRLSPGSLLLVLSGAGQLSYRCSTSSAPVHSIVVPGDLIGSLNLTCNTAELALSPARVDFHIATVDRSALLNLVLAHPQAAAALLDQLDRQRQWAERRLSRQVSNCAVDRIIALLIDLLQLARIESSNSAMIPFDVTQTDLGNLAGTSRQSTNRALQTLHRSGLIDRFGRRIYINNIPQLKATSASSCSPLPAA